MPKKIPWDIKSLNILTSLITKQQNILLDSVTPKSSELNAI